MGSEHVSAGTWQWEYIYKVLVEQANDGLYMIGLHTSKILFSNLTFARMFGYTTEELEGTRVEDIHLPEDRCRMKSALRRVLRGERVVEEFWCKTRSGEWVCIEVKPGLIELAGNQFIACVARDITERKRTEQALRKSEEEARWLAHESAVVAEIGRIISSSADIHKVYERFAERVKQLIPFDRVAVTITDVIHGTFTTAYAAGIELAKREQGRAIPLPGTATELISQTGVGRLIKLHDGDELTHLVPGLLPSFEAGLRSSVIVPLVSNDKVIGVLFFESTKPDVYADRDLALAERVGAQIAGAIANAQLYAERERAEEALRESERRVRELATASVRAHEEERQWAALEVHDRIAQPLVSVFHQLQGLQYMTRTDPRIQPVVQRSSTLLQEAIRESQNIMNDLYPAGLDEFGVVPLMEAELSRFQEDTGCRVSFDADAEVMPSQEVGVTLYRIFHEALTNIQRHAPGAQNVVVSLRYREMFVSLEIQDDGPGFDMEAATEDSHIGGLMSMQRRTEIIGGSFEVTSKPGEGTVVSICVPIASA